MDFSEGAEPGTVVEFVEVASDSPGEADAALGSSDGSP